MSLDPSLVKLLQDAESALEALVAAQAIPALEAELNSVLPASVKPYALAVEAATLSAAQAGLASLLAKIPQA